MNVTELAVTHQLKLPPVVSALIADVERIENEFLLNDESICQKFKMVLSTKNECELVEISMAIDQYFDTLHKQLGFTRVD